MGLRLRLARRGAHAHVDVARLGRLSSGGTLLVVVLDRSLDGVLAAKGEAGEDRVSGWGTNWLRWDVVGETYASIEQCSFTGGRERPSKRKK